MRMKLFLAVLGQTATVNAFFRMSCPGRIVRERLDPIVNPGSVSSHVHTISGGSGFSANMSYADARASKCSSCQIKEDMSNYWTPTLYVHLRNGSFTPVPVIGDPSDTNGGMTVYYLQRPGNSTDYLTAFPAGFRMLAGNPFNRSFSNNSPSKAISFACLGTNTAETNYMPNYPCPGGLRAQVFFPACWNGRELDTADHKSHMSYPLGREYNTGRCPPEFPVHFISLFYEVLYDTALFKDEWVNGTQPFVFANGDSTGYGFHGDFLNGWDVPVLQKAIDTCTDDSGLVERCQAVTMFTPAQCNACKVAYSVTENTGGVLKKLPGCNPITSGPSPAPKTSCPDDPAKIGPWGTNYVDLTASKGWSYIGCGRDNVSDRAFPSPNRWTYNANMTVEGCVQRCSTANFTYAALEYANECFCGSKLDARYAPQDGIMGACTMKCAGNQAQTCGGASATSIYKLCKPGEACKNNEIGGKAPSS